jgi:hypothetical protein
VTQEPAKAPLELMKPSQEDFALGKKVFRDLADSLNINPTQETWEREFLAVKNSATPVRPQVLEELWNASNDSGRKFLPKPDEKKEESPALEILDVSPKKLYLAGTGFLFLGIVIIVWMFKDVDFSRGDPDKVTTLMAAMILKPILGAAALAWAVHGLFGKRKGYMFLVFAITWALVMAWCAIKFREGFNESRVNSKAKHHQFITFASLPTDSSGFNSIRN